VCVELLSEKREEENTEKRGRRKQGMKKKENDVTNLGV